MPQFTTPLGHSECPAECDRGATNQQTDSHYKLSFSLGSVCLRLFYSWRPAVDERPHSGDCQLLPVTRFGADLRNRGQTAGTHFIAQKKRELRVTKLNLSVPLEAKPSHPSRRDSSRRFSAGSRSRGAVLGAEMNTGSRLSGVGAAGPPRLLSPYYNHSLYSPPPSLPLMFPLWVIFKV